MDTKADAAALARSQHQLVTLPQPPGSDWLIRELVIEHGCMGGLDELEVTIRMSAKNSRAANELVKRLVQMMKEQT